MCEFPLTILEGELENAPEMGTKSGNGNQAETDLYIGGSSGVIDNQQL